MDLSIIIVNYNTKKLTLDCIGSIVDSKPKLKYEVIVIDNGSRDKSFVAISKFKDKNSRLKLRIIRNEKNRGFAKASNQGINKSKGKYVLLLNSDTKIKKGAIDKLVSFAEKTDDAGAVVPKLLNRDGSIQPSAYYLPTILRVFSPKKSEKFIPKTETIEAAVMAAYLITPKALKEVGLLNEKYFMYFEDLDYARRLKRAGLKIYYYPDSEVIHEHGASGRDIADGVNQWRRLIPSSKIYHGTIKHYIITFILWSGQKWQKLLKKGQN